MGEGQFDSRLLAQGARKIRGANQRAVEARRRDFQPIGLADRILDIDHRRQGVVNFLAFVDGQRAIRPLGHDLDDGALPGREFDAHQTKAHGIEHALRNRGDPRGHAGFRDKTRLIKRSVRILDRRVQCLVNFGFGVRRCVQFPSVRSRVKQKRAGPARAPLPFKPSRAITKMLTGRYIIESRLRRKDLLRDLYCLPAATRRAKKAAARNGVCRRRPFALTWLKNGP